MRSSAFRWSATPILLGGSAVLATGRAQAPACALAGRDVTTGWTGRVGAEVTGQAPLRLVADVPMPGTATRFDYQSFDPHTGHLYVSHMNSGQLVIFDTRERRV